MSTSTTHRQPAFRGYDGLRLSAEEYFELADDGHKYELIDGVVCMSPSPSVRHQAAAFEIGLQLGLHVRETKCGFVTSEIDVRLPKARRSEKCVYRPELMFIAAPRDREIGSRIELVPDLVVEVISADYRKLDTEKKFHDYEAAGVLEYWLIDPIEKRCNFFRLIDGKYVEIAAQGDEYASEAVPGFRLNLPQLREAFERG